MRPEDIEQIKVFDWIRQHPEIAPDCFHIANERKTSVVEGMKLKRMGVQKGVADICVAIPARGYHGLYIELKTESGRLGKEQKAFLDRKRERGYIAMCCRGHQEAIDAIRHYLLELYAF